MAHASSVACAISSRPGPIDNTDLIGDAPDLVRLDAAEGEDFVLVPDELFTQLMCWYGGGPTFTRFAVDLSAASSVAGAPARLEVDVWPIPLTVRFAEHAGSSGSARRKTATEVVQPAEFQIRVGAQKTWAELFASVLHLRSSLVSKRLHSMCPWPDGRPLSLDAIQAIPALSLEDIRLHVQVRTSNFLSNVLLFE